jgi:hypothetical protein
MKYGNGKNDSETDCTRYKKRYRYPRQLRPPYRTQSNNRNIYCASLVGKAVCPGWGLHLVVIMLIARATFTTAITRTLMVAMACAELIELAIMVIRLLRHLVYLRFAGGHKDSCRQLVGVQCSHDVGIGILPYGVRYFLLNYFVSHCFWILLGASKPEQFNLAPPVECSRLCFDALRC